MGHTHRDLWGRPFLLSLPTHCTAPLEQPRDQLHDRCDDLRIRGNGDRLRKFPESPSLLCSHLEHVVTPTLLRHVSEPDFSRSELYCGFESYLRVKNTRHRDG